MRVVHITSNDSDGAGRAVLRLHRGLLELGVDSVVVVRYQRTSEPGVVGLSDGRSIRERIGNLKAAATNRRLRLREAWLLSRQLFQRLQVWSSKSYWKPRSSFSFNSPSVLLDSLRPLYHGADVIYVHDVQSILTPEQIAQISTSTSAPIVFHLLDMEPLTGGCHFNGGCTRYQEHCGNCPQLGRAGDRDISWKIFKRKESSLKSVPLHFVATNNFALGRVRQSRLFHDHPASVIFLGIEPERFQNIEKRRARQKLQLPAWEGIILFGALNFRDTRKGAQVLREVIRDHLGPKLQADPLARPVRLVTFGSSYGFTFEDSILSWTHLGHIDRSEEMNDLYRAADVLASPSIDDLGPTTVAEAFMNDLPVVSFDIGLSQDLITNGVNGFRVPRFDAAQFAEALFNVLRGRLQRGDPLNRDRVTQLKNCCTMEYEARAHRDLFLKILADRRRAGQLHAAPG